MGMHTHDFAEIFWVNEDAGLHLLNGRRERNAPDPTYQRPDREALTSAWPRAFSPARHAVRIAT